MAEMKLSKKRVGAGVFLSLALLLISIWNWGGGDMWKVWITWSGVVLLAVPAIVMRDVRRSNDLNARWVKDNYWFLQIVLFSLLMIWVTANKSAVEAKAESQGCYLLVLNSGNELTQYLEYGQTAYKSPRERGVPAPEKGTFTTEIDLQNRQGESRKFFLTIS